MSRSIQWWLRRVLVIILISGTLLTAWSVYHEDANLRGELLVKAKIAANGIPISQIQALSGSDADLGSSEYISLKHMVTGIRSADEKIRFAYIMGRRDDGTIFFFIDSEPPDSEDYSPPGQVYQEATVLVKNAFDWEEELTGGPDSDRWGTWVSAMVPLYDAQSGELVGVYGMDLDARDWSSSLIIAAAPWFLGTLLLLFLVMAFLFFTEQKQKESAILKESQKTIQESEERYRLLFTQSPIGIVQVDKNGIIVTVNQKASEFLGVPPNTLIGVNVRTQLRNPGLISAIKGAPKGKMGYFEGEYRSMFSDKSSFLRVIAHPLITEEGEYSGSIGIIEDITERKHTEQALFHANQKLNLLNSITRHDILNQLLALKGYLELSNDFQNDPGKQRDIIEKAKKAADTIEHQIRFTRDYQEMGVKAAIWQDINLCILRSKGILPLERFTIETSGTDYEIFADPLFEKVFYNLFENTIRHGGDRARTIRVDAHESDEGLVIVYTDDGAGISDEVRNSLFEQRTGAQKGLGMFLARQILAITGITINETGIHGKGARFEIRVPRGGYRRMGDSG